MADVDYDYGTVPAVPREVVMMTAFDELRHLLTTPRPEHKARYTPRPASRMVAQSFISSAALCRKLNRPLPLADIVTLHMPTLRPDSRRKIRIRLLNHLLAQGEGEGSWHLPLFEERGEERHVLTEHGHKCYQFWLSPPLSLRMRLNSAMDKLCAEVLSNPWLEDDQ